MYDFSVPTDFRLRLCWFGNVVIFSLMSGSFRILLSGLTNVSASVAL